MADIWKIKTDYSPGWVEQIFEGAPLMTGNVYEAQQFTTREEAELVIAGFPADRVRMHPVRSAPHPIVHHGDKPGGVLG